MVCIGCYTDFDIVVPLKAYRMLFYMQIIDGISFYVYSHLLHFGVRCVDDASTHGRIVTFFFHFLVWFLSFESSMCGFVTQDTVMICRQGDLGSLLVWGWCKME